jgi:hypothetical protein
MDTWALLLLLIIVLIGIGLGLWFYFNNKTNIPDPDPEPAPEPSDSCMESLIQDSGSCDTTTVVPSNVLIYYLTRYKAFDTTTFESCPDNYAQVLNGYDSTDCTLCDSGFFSNVALTQDVQDYLVECQVQVPEDPDIPFANSNIATCAPGQDLTNLWCEITTTLSHVLHDENTGILVLLEGLKRSESVTLNIARNMEYIRDIYKTGYRAARENSAAKTYDTWIKTRKAAIDRKSVVSSTRTEVTAAEDSEKISKVVDAARRGINASSTVKQADVAGGDASADGLADAVDGVAEDAIDAIGEAAEREAGYAEGGVFDVAEASAAVEKTAARSVALDILGPVVLGILEPISLVADVLLTINMVSLLVSAFDRAGWLTLGNVDTMLNNRYNFDTESANEFIRQGYHHPTFIGPFDSMFMSQDDSVVLNTKIDNWTNLITDLSIDSMSSNVAISDPANAILATLPESALIQPVVQACTNLLINSLSDFILSISNVNAVYTVQQLQDQFDAISTDPTHSLLMSNVHQTIMDMLCVLPTTYSIPGSALDYAGYGGVNIYPIVLDGQNNKPLTGWPIACTYKTADECISQTNWIPTIGYVANNAVNTNYTQWISTYGVGTNYTIYEYYGKKFGSTQLFKVTSSTTDTYFFNTIYSTALDETACISQLQQDYVRLSIIPARFTDQGSIDTFDLSIVYSSTVPFPSTQDGISLYPYTEWRSKDQLTTQPQYIIRTAANSDGFFLKLDDYYDYSLGTTVPIDGACIVTSPLNHLYCNKETVLVNPYEMGGNVYVYNRYDRNGGYCSIPAFACSVFGLTPMTTDGLDDCKPNNGFWGKLFTPTVWGKAHSCIQNSECGGPPDWVKYDPNNPGASSSVLPPLSPN